MKSFLLAIAAMAMVISGCALRVLPEEALSEVDPSVDYSQVKADPNRYAGTTLLVGGRIVRNDADSSGTTLEVLRYILDRWGYPTEVDESGGRFLARIDRFLDPEVYAKDRFIVMTGSVAGEETRELNGVPYKYPVFRIRSGTVMRNPWPAGAPYGYPHPFYRPYGYDPYWYDPFWYDPFYPHGRWYRHDPFWYR